MERNHSRNATPTIRTHKIPTEILDDLASRFIINFPEKDDIIRVCFQLELAHWFYTDEYVLNESYNLRNCTMNEFSKHMWGHIPFLKRHGDDVDQILENWKQYKMAVPTYGAIMLNEDLTQVVLVQSYWNKTSWGFPKGKVNEFEAPHLCAVREVMEETGYSIADKIDPEAYSTQIINDQECVLFFIPGVPMNTKFKPIAKFEIRGIEWYPLDLLPSSKKDPIPDALHLKYNSLYMVMPFVRSIRQWVASRNRRHDHRRRSTQPTTPNPHKQKAQQTSAGHTSAFTAPKKTGPGRKDSFSEKKAKTEQVPAPYGSMEYMPKAWMNFKVDKKALYQAMDSVLPTQ